MEKYFKKILESGEFICDGWVYSKCLDLISRCEAAKDGENRMLSFINSDKCDTDAKFERAERMYNNYTRQVVECWDELEKTFEKYVFILKAPFTVGVKLLNP